MVTQRKYPGYYRILLNIIKKQNRLKTHHTIAELLTLSENTGSPRPRESSLFWKFWLKFWLQLQLQNMLQPNTGNVCRWRLTHISSFVDSNSIFWQRDGHHCHSYDAADNTYAQQASWSGTRNERNSGSGSSARTSETWDIFDSLQIYTFNVNIFLIHLYLFKYICLCIIIYITII